MGGVHVRRELTIATDLARLLRRHWGARATSHEFIRSKGIASVVIYDACKVTLAGDPEGVRVWTQPAPPATTPRVDVIVPREDVDRVLEDIDAACRLALPPAFIHRFDEWANSGGELRAGGSDASPRVPGPTVTDADLDAEIHNFWMDSAVVLPGDDSLSGDLRRTIRLYNMVDVVVVRNEPHKQLTGGIVVGDGVESSDFGTWFMADHPDAEGLRELMRRLDDWVRLRLGPDGTSVRGASMPYDDEKFDDTYFAREERFSVGTERPSGRFYLSIPVSNGVVDYEEYYELTRAQYDAFVADRAAAATFAEECRRHEHDELLLHKPGSNRGTPV